MKKSKKGFVLAETLIVSTVVLSTLVLIFVQFSKVNGSYKKAFNYNTVDGLYAVNNIREFIQNDNYDFIKSRILSGYVDITDCWSDLYTELSYCNDLYSILDVKTVILTTGDLSSLKKSMVIDELFNENVRELITRTGDTNSDELYHLFVEFNDGTASTLIIK